MKRKQEGAVRNSFQYVVFPVPLSRRRNKPTHILLRLSSCDDLSSSFSINPYFALILWLMLLIFQHGDELVAGF
jgi:hypothetical protein